MWWPVWIAPLPVLLLAPKLRGWQAFIIATVARGIGALNMWNYIHHVVQLSLVFTAATILVPSIMFALATIVYRNILRKGHFAFAALSFPAVMVTAEYLISLSQGTFLSTGYTQLGNLPILQIAALTGIWGITFVVCLLPSVIAVLIFARDDQRLRLAATFAGVYVCVLCFGLVRLYGPAQKSDSVLVGLVEVHRGPFLFPSDSPNAMALMERYAAEIKPLASRGAQFVIFPEMSALVPDSIFSRVDELLRRSAQDAHVQVVLGVLHPTDNRAYNEARVYSATGEIETVYRKHHLVPSWESQSTPGTELSTLTQPIGRIGIEICRDMDYPELARGYAKQQVGLVLVPAWDQGIEVDAEVAQHGRTLCSQPVGHVAARRR